MALGPGVPVAGTSNPTDRAASWWHGPPARARRRAAFDVTAFLSEVAGHLPGVTPPPPADSRCLLLAARK